MRALRINGATRELGRAQGYIPLHVLDIVADDCPFMVTAWEPTPEELAMLAAGAPVFLWIMGQAHPPVRLEVGEAPK